VFGPELELGVSDGPFVRRGSARLRCNPFRKNATKSAVITPRTSPMPMLETIVTVSNAFAHPSFAPFRRGQISFFSSSVKNHPSAEAVKR
jgi:hypothetical protein